MKDNLKNRNILFIGPEFYDYHLVIIDSLKRNGAEVSFFPESYNLFILHFLYLIFPKTKKYIHKFYFKYIFRKIKEKSYSHFLLIHGDQFSIEFLRKIKAQFLDIKCIMYQWDSNKNSSYFHLIDEFNKTYTFDYLDFTNNKKLNFLQLFYTSDIATIVKENEINKYDFFYLFSFTFERYEALIKILNFCSKNQFNLKYYCYIPKKTYLKYKYLKGVNLDKNLLSFTPLSRSQYLDSLKVSSIIIDVNHSTQTGLSMRIIEAYGAKKKLITTNKSILNNPIYSPAWVQIFDIDNLYYPEFDSESAFFYQNLSIDNWVNKILE